MAVSFLEDSRVAARVKRPRGQRGREFRRLLPIYLFILPGMALFTFWTLYPLLDAFVMSFFNWVPNPNMPSTFRGVQNYVQALTDPIFWQAFRNVLSYTIVTVAGQIVSGLAVALLLNRKLVARGLFRVIYYLPVVTSWVVVSLIFAYLFSSDNGPVDWFLGDVLHLIPHNQSWLGNTTLALPTLMILGIWKGIGWNMVMFLAGLQSIPTELYEAARVDGANSWILFRVITLPLLRPTITFMVVILTMGGFGSFIPMYVLTSGGPLHSTETLLTYAFTNAFSSFDFGYAAAITYIFAMVVFVLALMQIRLLQRKIEY
ncbi:carbohydrate ABC transporter permease [Dictyobacter aurantiacus]|uniref:Sugar ABC transporter permease n=1 Tax=Dictyobacter aurantiacus TaxID=1936993 RepID=A0A401ZGF1_9CHLR|nr:sugar ABC transporter permease [Dictyobacter aurantiacus]GCE05955.1 sugar ABC transporter permease [Dictyobacter aurantiacus]